MLNVSAKQDQPHRQLFYEKQQPSYTQKITLPKTPPTNAIKPTGRVTCTIFSCEQGKYFAKQSLSVIFSLYLQITKQDAIRSKADD